MFQHFTQNIGAKIFFANIGKLGQLETTMPKYSLQNIGTLGKHDRLEKHWKKNNNINHIQKKRKQYKNNSQRSDQIHPFAVKYKGNHVKHNTLVQHTIHTCFSVCFCILVYKCGRFAYTQRRFVNGRVVKKQGWGNSAAPIYIYIYIYISELGGWLAVRVVELPRLSLGALYRDIHMFYMFVS